MNTVDIVILAIIGLSVLIGLYRGLIASVASLGGCLLSLGLSYWLTPKAVSWIQANPDVMKTLLSYTDAATRLGDRTLAQTEVSALSSQTISDILGRVSLPAPLDSLLRTNLENEVFRSVNLTSVGDYVSQTILSAVIHIISFVVCFLVCLIVLHLVLNFLRVVFRFPVLKQLNSLSGGVFGLLRGALLCFVAFALLPLVETVVPLEGIPEMVAESTLAPIFNSDQLILSIMNGKIF